MTSTTDNQNEGRPDFDHEHGHRHSHGRGGGGRYGRGFRARKLLFIPMILAFVAIKTALVMVLWNHLIPDLFQGPQLDFVHALGLVILAKLLTGFGRGGPPGFGPFGGHRGHWRRHHLFKERWSKMTPEQREKMRQAMRDRFE